MAKPYNKKDKVMQDKFQRISNYCALLKDADTIVSLVFDAYDEEQQHAELIVRIPHMLGHYCNDPKKSKEISETYSDLRRFYTNECIPIIEHTKKEMEQKQMLKVVKKYAFKYCLSHFIVWIALIIGFLKILTLILLVFIYKFEVKKMLEDLQRDEESMIQGKQFLKLLTIKY
jgi:hypothetical protein